MTSRHWPADTNDACCANGVLIEIGGHYGNVARFLPPLVLTEDLARTGVDVFAGAVLKSEVVSTR